MGTPFEWFLFLSSTAYQLSQQRKMREEADKRKGFALTISGVAENIPVAYGKNVLGGIEVKHKVNANYTAATDNSDKTFAQGFSNTTVNDNTKNEFLNVQYVLCQDGIEGVQWVKVNDLHYDASGKDFKHIIRTHKDGGTADAIATANGIPSTNIFTKTASASATFRLNRDEYNYNGVPSMQFLVKGRKIHWIEENSGVYSLSTNKEYSNNPALCLLDYLMNSDFGRGLSVSEVDLESFYNAADVCDTIVETARTTAGKVNGQKAIHTVANLSSRPTNLEKRTYENELWYTTLEGQYWYWDKTSWVETSYDTSRPIPLYECNITLDTASTLRDNIERILNTMGLAELTWSSEGKYKLLLEYPTSASEEAALVDSSLVFTDDDIIRDSITLSWPSASDRFNQVTVNFLNEHEDFKEDSLTWPKTNSTAYNTYLTEDNNQPLLGNLTLDGVTDPYHALASAEQAVRKSRTIYNLNFRVSKKGLKIEPGDFIKVNSSVANISNEIFRVESIKVAADFSVELSCYKFNYEDLAWNILDNIAYATPPTFDFSVSPPTADPVDSFTSTSNDILGTASGKLSWTAAEDISATQYLVEISPDNGTTWHVLGTTRATTFDVVGLDTGTYDFSIRSMSPSGTLSSRHLIEDETIQLKTVDKVAIIYADTANAATNTQSYTLGSNEYVAYYTYSSDLPTLPITSGITFAKFVGEDGTSGTPSWNSASIYLDGFDNTPDATGELFLHTSSSSSTRLTDNAAWPNTAAITLKEGGFQSSSSGGTGFVNNKQALSSLTSGSGGSIVIWYSNDNWASYKVDASTAYYDTALGYFTFNLEVLSSKGIYQRDEFYTIGLTTGTIGERGAGWWRYETGTSASTAGLSNSAVESFFSTATSLDEVAGDRIIIVNTSDEATGYLRNNANTSWTEQEEFIDGNLLVNGTITGSKIQASTITADNLSITGNLSALTADLGDVNVNEVLTLTGQTSGIQGGKTSLVAYDEDGFFVGKTRNPDTSPGFEFSHTNVNTSNNQIEGVIHNDISGFQIFNPTFKTGGSASGGSTTYTSTQTINLGSGNDSITYSAIGGGGAGGYGLDDGTANSTTGGSQTGGNTEIELWAGVPDVSGSVRIHNATASGGTAGTNAVSSRFEAGGGNGESSNGLSGGSGGGMKSAGSAASLTHYGAGGGGGGGDYANSGINPDSGGAGGDGGNAGQNLNATINTSSYSSSTLYFRIVSIGAGGATNTGGDYNGGAGAPGAVVVSSLLSGMNSYSMTDLLNSESYPTIIANQYVAYSSTLSNLQAGDTIHYYGWLDSDENSGQVTFNWNNSVSPTQLTLRSPSTSIFYSAYNGNRGIITVPNGVTSCTISQGADVDEFRVMVIGGR